MRKLNLILSFFLCSIASFLVLHQLHYPLTGIDDANIYLVYARNLADGYGFVYNVGGERVEGFTSLLWTLICTLAFKFSAQPELTLLIINITVVSLGIAYALHFLQSHGPPGEGYGNKFIWSALFLTLIFTSPRYVAWNTITLMENALWSTLLLVTTIFVIREPISFHKVNLGFSATAILLILTRPESVLWVALFTIVLFLRFMSAGSMIQALKVIVPSIAVIGLTLALLTLFRLQYFGYPLPNTYYAKVSPSFAYNLEQGTIYLIRYFLSDPIAGIGVIVILMANVNSLLKSSVEQGLSFLPLLALTGLLIPLLTGGDHFGSFRFYQNVYPITVLCLIYFVRQVLPQRIEFTKYKQISSPIRVGLSLFLALITTFGCFLSQANAWSNFSSEMSNEFNVAAYERRNGAFIAELFSSLPRLPSIGVIASGGIKYSYRGEIIDLMGLNNTIMAHNQGERTGYKNHAAFEVWTFYELQPDLVWPLNVNESHWQYSEAELKGRWENLLGFKGLFNDPDFLESYVYAQVSQNSEVRPKTALVAWFRKDFIQSLAVNPEFRVEVYQYTSQ